MQAAMDRLERTITRHRKVVLVVWAIVLLASLPFAAQQTKHLTAGGFEVPGSGSLTASQALTRFPGRHPGRDRRRIGPGAIRG